MMRYREIYGAAPHDTLNEINLVQQHRNLRDQFTQFEIRFHASHLLLLEEMLDELCNSQIAECLTEFLCCSSDPTF